MKNILVSVIIPTFNSKNTISFTINALKKQKTSFNFELIVVDNNSTDDTKNIIKKIDNVKLVEEKKQGPAAARNRGVKFAKGNIIVFTDSDCVPKPDFLEKLVKPIIEGKAVGCQGAYRTKQKKLISRFIQLEIENRYELLKKNDAIDFVGSYAAAYDKKTFLAMNGFDEFYSSASGEDTELSYKFSNKGYKLLFIDDAITYHTHPESIFKYLKVKFYRAAWRIPLYKKHVNKIAKDSYTPQSIKIGILGILFFLIGLFLSLFYFQAGILFISIGLLFNLYDSLKLIIFGFKRSFYNFLFIFIILFLRNLVFLFGLMKGFFIRGNYETT